MQYDKVLLAGVCVVLSMACSPTVPLLFDTGVDVRRDTGRDVRRDTGALDSGVAEDRGLTCYGGQVVCDGRCVSTASDRMNCGSCGNVCPEGQVCAAGECHFACPSGLSACPASVLAWDAGPDAMVAEMDSSGTGEVCVDLQNSRLNCGTCGNVCPAGANCGYGRCYRDCGRLTYCEGTGGGDGGGLGYCADLTWNQDNCGACGHACPAMSHQCVSGHCVINCTAPQVACAPTTGAPDGYCANLATDAMNCGMCGRTCPGGQTCAASACRCASPMTACGADCVDLRNDASNCGACGRACSTGQYCNASTCTACGSRVVCGSGPCTDLNTDPANCGACGNACSHGMACITGTCRTAPLYHGWSCPLPGCDTSRYNTMAATVDGGFYPFISGDGGPCRAWKLAATICTTMPAPYSGMENWSCPMSGGFTDPLFGTYCPVTNQYSCSSCPGACNATPCSYMPLSLRNCSGAETAQP